MFEDLKSAINEFKNAKSIAIYTPRVNTVDKAFSIIALYKICKSKGKNVQFICPSIFSVSIKNMFKEEVIEVTEKPVSKDYVVSIDYSVGSIDKVICKRDEDKKKLNFVITPQDEDFDFENIEFISGGSSFDLIFSFDITKKDSLPKEFEEMFNKIKTVSISKKESEFGDYKFVLNGDKSYSEIIYEFVKSASDVVSEEIINILLGGVFAKYKLIEGGENDGWLIANNLIKFGADFDTALRYLYYSKDYENFELQKKVFENVRVDKKNRVIWSKINIMMDVDKKNLDIKGRIPFNICKDFDIAFVIYHLDNENIKIVFESNDPQKYCAFDLMKVFSGSATKSRAVFTNKDIIAEDFVPKFFETIKTLYDIRIS